jgi:paired amphipathic helix protein Sin3a
LPEDYPPFISTGREEGVSKELNDRWITIGHGSEDYSFNYMRKNIFEEELFKCEDERFEQDLTINRYTAAIDIFEKLYKDIQDATEKGET